MWKRPEPKVGPSQYMAHFVDLLRKVGLCRTGKLQNGEGEKVCLWRIK